MASGLRSALGPSSIIDPEPTQEWRTVSFLKSHSIWMSNPILCLTKCRRLPKSSSQNVNSQNVNSQNVNSQNVNSQKVNSQNVNSQKVNSQNVNSLKVNSQNINFPEYQLPKMSTPKSYILTKYTSYMFKLFHSLWDCTTSISSSLYIAWYIEDNFKTYFDSYREDDNNHSYHFELMLTHTAIVA